MKICLIDETGTGDGALSVLAARWGLEHDEDNLMALVLTPEHLELRKRDEPKLGGIFVDFVGGAMAHRRKFGGGRGEAVAKAVGIKGDYLPDVVDATAGLGRDAFVLASVGCRVRMLERNPVGKVEGGEVPVADVEVDHIDNEAVPQAVEQVAQRAANNQRISDIV